MGRPGDQYLQAGMYLTEYIVTSTLIFQINFLATFTNVGNYESNLFKTVFSILVIQLL